MSATGSLLREHTGQTGEVTDAARDLERWLASGGEGRVLSETGDELVVGLFTCDGGEQMGQVVGPASELRPLLTDD